MLKKADASNGYRLWITADGVLQFEVLIGGTKTTATSVAPIPLNTWQHVAAWYDGFQIRVYIGRRIMGEENVKGALTGTTEPLYMGYHDGTSHHLHGYLDDVSIYACTFSQIEVEELIDNPVGRYEHHHTNALGSNIVLTDEGKNVVARYEYDVFGAVRSETGTSDNPRKFTGKEYESDVKLYYYGARYYDPYVGRFTQRDPIAKGVNWYAYTANNPLKFVDPDGRAIKFAASNETIDKDTNLDNFNVGKLTPEDQTLFAGLFGADGAAAGHNTSLLDLNATGDMLTNVINQETVITLEWGDLGQTANGHFLRGDNSIVINNNTTPPEGEAAMGYNLEELDKLRASPSISSRPYADFRLTLIHELQHAAHMFGGVPPDVPNPGFPISENNRKRWRSDYSAYRTESRAANELGQINPVYFGVAVAPSGGVGTLGRRALERAATNGL